MAATLLELRTRARNRADMTSSLFVDDSELNDYINASIAELHDILVQAYGSDYFLAESNFQTVINQETYDLPTDFYKLRGVDAKVNGTRWLKLTRFNFNERNRFEDFGVWDLNGVATIRYRVMGSKIRFTPVPDRDVDVRLFYVPLATILSADTDTLDDFNQYSEYVILDAAIKMLAKEESDTAVFERQKAALVQRITDVANNRDAGDPSTVTDIYAEDNEEYFNNVRS